MPVSIALLLIFLLMGFRHESLRRKWDKRFNLEYSSVCSFHRARHRKSQTYLLPEPLVTSKSHLYRVTVLTGTFCVSAMKDCVCVCARAHINAERQGGVGSVPPLSQRGLVLTQPLILGAGGLNFSLVPSFPHASGGDPETPRRGRGPLPAPGVRFPPPILRSHCLKCFCINPWKKEGKDIITRKRSV